MTDHTPEPWVFDEANEGKTFDFTFGIYAENGSGLSVAHVPTDHPEDARRIVACVNACAGIPTAWLEDKAALPLAELKAEVDADLTAARERITELEAALGEIAKGEGAFDPDPFTHAYNCVENMKSIALAALARKQEAEA